MPLELPPDKPAAVLFKSPSCGNCERLLPIFREAITPYQTNIKTEVVDIREDIQSAVNYGVLSVPIIIFFKNGKEVNRLVGLVSRDKIIKSLQLLTL